LGVLSPIERSLCKGRGLGDSIGVLVCPHMVILIWTFQAPPEPRIGLSCFAINRLAGWLGILESSSSSIIHHSCETCWLFFTLQNMTRKSGRVKVQQENGKNRNEESKGRQDKSVNSDEFCNSSTVVRAIQYLDQVRKKRRDNLATSY